MVAHAVDASLTGSATLVGGLTAALTLGSALTGSAAVAADLDQAHNSTAAALSGSATVAADLTGAVPVTAALTGSAAVAADLDQAHNSTAAALSGSATVVANIEGMVPVTAALAGTAVLTPPVILVVDANPAADLLGGSFLIGVALIRPPFLAPTVSEAAPDQFPGLNTNRVRPPRIEKVVVNPFPPRRRER